MTSPQPSFKTLDAYHRYQIIVGTIENEKDLLMSLLTRREQFIQSISDYDGHYAGMQSMVNDLKATNANITRTKQELARLTKKYYELLKYFTWTIADSKPL